MSVSDSHWSEELVGMSVVEVHVRGRFNLVSLSELHTTGVRNRRNLNLVVSLLISLEHLPQAVFEELFGFSFAHVSSPRILQENLAVVKTKTSRNKVLIFNFCSMEICSAQEHSVLFVNTADNRSHVQWVAF